MPGVRGFSGLMYMRAQYPSVPVVIVSANDDPAVIRRCMDFGASGFIPKTLGVDQIRKAIEVVLEGGIWTPPDIDLVRQVRRRQFGDAGAALLADAAAGARADDAVGRAAQQADRLRARRLRGDRQGACLGDPAEARRRKPHPGGDRGLEDRSRPVVAGARRSRIEPAAFTPSLRGGDAMHRPLRHHGAQRRRFERLVEHRDRQRRARPRGRPGSDRP